MRQALSPRALAEAVGVSESSIKRWVDEGVIRASRTAGGHRRIDTREVVRFLRDTDLTVALPDKLGIADLAKVRGSAADFSDSADLLYDLLRTGAAAEARGLIVSLYLGGSSVARIVDGPLREAMVRIGDLWGHEPGAIFQEHRATAIVVQSLSQLRSLLEPPEAAPVTLGCAPAGDPYILPTLSVATVLEALEVRAMNLGPNLPLSALCRGVELVEPALVWLSVTSASDPKSLASEVGALLERLAEAGRGLVIGGRQAAEIAPDPQPNLHMIGSMTELEDFAKGLFGSDRRA